ncbi:MAG: hypothetical protein IJE78_01075 [Bacteroidaceae bacterium]|nr:hypothetical protein [Bacteroidaceae bacterium]
MELQRKDKQELQQELSEFLLQYYDGSFSRMACDYIHATGMKEEEVEALLEAMKKAVKNKYILME